MEIPQIKLIIDKDCPQLSVFIRARERNETVRGVISAIRTYAEGVYPSILVSLDESARLLSQKSIVRIYIVNRKVMVEAEGETFVSRKNLTEIEQILDPERFVRISKSEIINISQVIQFDFSAAGTIGVELSNGETTWVARRRMKDVKKMLEH